MGSYLKKSFWCGISVLALAVGSWIWQSEWETAQASPTVSNVASGKEIVSHVIQVGEQFPQVIVLDPVLRRLAVYSVNPQSGEIQLKSVRNLQADLQMQEFNSTNPSPLEIHKMQQRN